MKAEELRIGNLVGRFVGINDDGADYKKIKITSISESGEYSYIDGDTFMLVINGLEDLSGIELTEEWLIKMGFVRNMDTYYLNDLGLSWLTTEDNFQTEYKLADSKWMLLDLKYVHQLQNLYFALTGEELTIKN